MLRKFTNYMIIALALFLAVGVASQSAAANANVSQVIVFNTPAGADEPGPVLPGHAYEISFSAEPGQQLSFATMMVQSNDRFFSPNEQGIALYDADGNPRSGDVTDWVYLLDAGTEIDEEPGTGPYQAIRQPAPNTGPTDPNNTVHYAHDNFGITPAINKLIKATLTASDDNMFTLRLENASGGDFISPLAPGIVVLHTGVAPLFNISFPDRGQGLEALAEDGNPMPLAQSLGGVMDETDMPEDEEDGEDTPPPPVMTNENVYVFNTPAGASEPGPALPGDAYEVTFSAERGQAVSFATMMVQSNDRFFAPFEYGIALYDTVGNPRSGDVTSQVYLWDAGTEIDEEPGTGPNQAIRQSAPNTGLVDPNNNVRYAVDSFGITPPTNQLIKVTLESLGNDMFTLRMENVSGSDFVSPLSPGLVVIHSERAPLFSVGQPDRGQGLEAIAEDGNPMMLAESLGN